MLAGPPPPMSPAVARRVERWLANKQQANHARVENFKSAVAQLYAERMTRTSNPATIRCPPEDAAKAREIVAGWLTYQAGACRFDPMRVPARP